MKISVGMFAWNEEENIANTIKSLAQQSVFCSRLGCFENAEWRIVVVANGCSDKTASVSRTALAQNFSEATSRCVTTEVFEIAEAGKSNAWNKYVHSYEMSDTDIFVMIDSDIEFGHEDTIFNSIQLLIDNPSCWVAVDKPLKDFARKKNLSFLERLSLGFSNKTFEREPAIAGSFYCARGATLREIWMPKGLPAEDGFLKAMIVTNCFRSESVPSRVMRAPNADHYYEGLTDLKAIFKHEVRVVVGTVINCYLTWDFLKFATDPNGPGAGHLIKSWLEQNPDRFKMYIQNEIRNRGYWVLPRRMIYRRIAPLGRLSFLAFLKKMPLAIMAFVFDLLVLTSANKKLKSGEAIGFW